VASHIELQLSNITINEIWATYCIFRR